MNLRMLATISSLAVISVLPAVSHERTGYTPPPELVPYSIEVLVDGAPLQKHDARGATYIEAIEGRDYSIRLSNNSGGRVAIALSVDGLNSIDAKTTTARAASKWILDPWQSITLDGWQTSSATARRFYFTSEKESYGAWLGKTSNLGIISAAVFRERQPIHVPIWKDKPSSPEPQKLGGQKEGSPAPSLGQREDSRSSRDADDLAATGIGHQVDHHVTRIPFDAESSPAAVLSLRYEYHDALVRLGVLACDDSLGRRERASGFEDTGFAPDPFRPRCR